MLSLLWRQMAPRGSLSREMAEISLAGHSFLALGSLAPVPVVDGGIIMKWKLVEAGCSPQQAERVVHQSSLGFGIVLLILGILLRIFRKAKLASGFLATCGGMAIAAGFDWLK